MGAQGKRAGRLVRAAILALAVLLVGFLVGVGASTLAHQSGLLADQPPSDGADAPAASNPASSEEGQNAADAAFRPPDASYTPWDPSTAPNYYRVVGPAVVASMPAPGEARYGSLDALGRATGVASTVTYDSMTAGRERERADTSSLAPSGWGYNAEVDMAMPDGSIYHGLLYNRSHLLAKSLGGDDELHNLVCATRTQNVGANVGGSEGGMAYGEGLARSWLESHPQGTLYYAATPVYEGNELVARSVIVDLHSSDGSLDQRIEVYNAALGFAIDYATGTFSVTGNAQELAQGLCEAATDAAQAGDGDAKTNTSPSPGEVIPQGSSESVGGERKVIVTGSGKAYHHDETCPGLANARSMEWVSISEAEAMGRHPCGICGG